MLDEIDIIILYQILARIVQKYFYGDKRHQKATLNSPSFKPLLYYRNKN